MHDFRKIFPKVSFLEMAMAYERLKQAMDASKITFNARVIMKNPLHFNYHQIAAHIQVNIFIDTDYWVNVSLSRMRE